MLTMPSQIYQQSAINTSSPIQLVLMLYDGAIRNIKLGIEGIENKQIEKASRHLIKSQSIINELVSALNLQYPVANQLLQIYDYMLRRLVEANIRKKKEPAVEVLNHLVSLREAWQEIAKNSSVTRHG